MVVGYSGDGKSSLINDLRDKEFSSSANEGLRPRGVTLEINSYPGVVDSSGRRLTFLDTPGLDQGDGPRHIVKATEQFITAMGWKLSDIIGVIVTVNLPTARLLDRHRLVDALVSNLCTPVWSEQEPSLLDRWNRIILVGTKQDRATDAELECFDKPGESDQLGRPLGLAQTFFEKFPGYYPLHATYPNPPPGAPRAHDVSPRAHDVLERLRRPPSACAFATSAASNPEIRTACLTDPRVKEDLEFQRSLKAHLAHLILKQNIFLLC